MAPLQTNVGQQSQAMNSPNLQSVPVRSNPISPEINTQPLNSQQNHGLSPPRNSTPRAKSPERPLNQFHDQNQITNQQIPKPYTGHQQFPPNQQPPHLSGAQGQGRDQLNFPPGQRNSYQQNSSRPVIEVEDNSDRQRPVAPPARPIKPNRPENPQIVSNSSSKEITYNVSSQQSQVDYAEIYGSPQKPYSSSPQQPNYMAMYSSSPQKPSFSDDQIRQRVNDYERAARTGQLSSGHSAPNLIVNQGLNHSRSNSNIQATFSPGSRPNSGSFNPPPISYQHRPQENYLQPLPNQNVRKAVSQGNIGGQIAPSPPPSSTLTMANSPSLAVDNYKAFYESLSPNLAGTPSTTTTITPMDEYMSIYKNFSPPG
ncbi:hypothetical protein HK096_005037, partial [Nowakowskiella sp. JEL0078]